jgi:hypothetical protein
MRAQASTFSESDVGELCDIADALAAAAYHLQKWAAILAPSEGLHKPNKPLHSEDKEEAFAVLHLSTSRVIVAAAAAGKGFKMASEEHNDEAESFVNSLGVPSQDIRALAPHLEALIFRVSCLSARLRPTQKLRDNTVA